MRRRAALVLFLFTVAVFAVLAYRQEQQAKTMRVNVYDQCVMRIENVHRTNGLYQGLVAIERANPYVKTSPSTVHRRIELFTAAMLIPPTCGENPR